MSISTDDETLTESIESETDGEDSQGGYFLPDWVMSLSTLYKASITVGGTEILLRESPINFTLAVFVDWLVGGIVTLVEGFVGYLWLVISTTIDAFLDALGVFGIPFEIVGGLILDLIGIVDGIVVSVAQIAGPAAPIVVVVLWAAVAYAFAVGARSALEVVKWI